MLELVKYATSGPFVFVGCVILMSIMVGGLAVLAEGLGNFRVWENRHGDTVNHNYNVPPGKKGTGPHDLN